MVYFNGIEACVSRKSHNHTQTQNGEILHLHVNVLQDNSFCLGIVFENNENCVVWFILQNSSFHINI